jgi:hypothetical protein
MKTIELFAGTRSFSKVARSLGHETFTTDYEEIDGQDLVKDIRQLTETDIPYQPDMIWASPPCEGFSVAAIGKNWNHDHTPKTDSARLGVELVENTLRIIKELNPTWWFIENPRGKLRKMPFMQGFTRHTVTYCQYGDTRMKPTDIWTNATWWTPRPMCKNGDTCHVAAPRGSRTGTQGIKGYKNRSRIPSELFVDIFNQYIEQQNEK